MKNFYIKLIILLTGISMSTIAQENVGIGTKQPDASAILDIQSSQKGLLIPRLSFSQRNEILNPANGLLVYQTNETSGFYFFDGKKWSPLTSNEAKSVAAANPDNWSLTGNSLPASPGVPVGTNFIGTTNNEPLVFKVANTQVGFLDYSYGSVFFGPFAGGVKNKLFNVAIGYSAHSINTNGEYNTAIGAYSMEKNTDGQQNSAFGFRALQNNTFGSFNVAFGPSSLKSNTIGASNLGIGSLALEQNTQGNYNIGIGINALTSNTVGSGNTAIGERSMRLHQSGDDNIAVGAQALHNNLTGARNVAIGFQAGYNETGSNTLYIANTSTPNPLIKGDFAGNNLKINSQTTGYLAIGDFSTSLPTSAPGVGGFPLPSNIGVAGGYRLVVQDGILCEKVKVALRSSTGSDWADYVFEPEYKAKMMSLEEVEKFTLDNKHLPNVPSAKEMIAEGLDVAKTSKMFMEKIEELTLYMIELNKEIKALKAENQMLKKN